MLLWTEGARPAIGGNLMDIFSEAGRAIVPNFLENHISFLKRFGRVRRAFGISRYPALGDQYRAMQAQFQAKQNVLRYF